MSFSTPSLAKDQLVETTKEAPSSLHVNLTALTGFGTFQDIQVPESDTKGFRGDGTSAAAENQDHLGFPLGVKFSLNLDHPGVFYSANFDLLNMSTLSGPPETASASYSRIQVSTGVGFRFFIDDENSYSPFIKVELEGRRTSFNNVSSEHFVSTLLPRLVVGLEHSKQWILRGYGAMGVNPKFGYGSGFSLGGKTFSASTVSVKESGMDLSFNVHKKTWLGFGVEEEAVDVKIDDSTEYNQFGLNVSSVKYARIYNLRTRLYHVDLQKRF